MKPLGIEYHQLRRMMNVRRYTHESTSVAAVRMKGDEHVKVRQGRIVEFRSWRL